MHLENNELTTKLNDTFNLDAWDGSRINLSCSHKSCARPDVTISNFRQVS